MAADCLLLTDLDGLSGGVADGGPPEDASLLDSRIAADTGGDLTAERSDADSAAARDTGFEASAIGFCAGQVGAHLLCADFDEGSLLSGWTATDQYGNGRVSLDTSNSLSPPASLLSVVGSADGGVNGGNSGRLALALPSSYKTLHLAFDVEPHLLLTSSSGGVELFAIHQVTTDGAYFGVLFRDDYTGPSILASARAEAGGVYSVTASTSLPPGWSHVDVTIVLSTTTSGSITVTFNLVAVAQLTNIITRTQDYARSYVDFGMFNYAGVGGSASYDNVVVDVQ